MSPGLVKERVTSYRHAIDCIQGKLEMKGEIIIIEFERVIQLKQDVLMLLR